mmetsp:Transcript_3796/g.9960  ORF Transcript_3796/g.9960 Transcript_3796/m.9960 type:complete len:397 (+) Transcript_3796:90-1280(+)
MLNEPIHVLGAGSIGLLWTASIRSKFPTYPITLLLRDHARNRERVTAARGSGRGSKTNNNHLQTSRHRLDISWNNRNFAHVKDPNEQEQISLPVQFIGDPQHEKERIKTLIVATKAHQAKHAVKSVLGRLLPPEMIDCKEKGDKEYDDKFDSAFSSSSPTRIIVLCNGALSVREELSKVLRQTQNRENTISLDLATTTHGAYLSEPDCLVHAGVGTTFLEQHTTNGLVDLWNRAGLKCTSLQSQQLVSMLWNKLAANCVINPLTSIFRCTNGELLLEPSFPELREEILNEVADVATDAADEDARAKDQDTGVCTTVSVPTIDEMRAFVVQTIRDTKNNKSSMYQDIITGKQQKTEIEHLNGYVVRKGKEMGRDCPINEDLCLRIAELASRNGSRDR